MDLSQGLSVLKRLQGTLSRGQHPGRSRDGARDWKWNLKTRCDWFRYLGLLSSSLKASVGVRHPRHFLGVPFKR